MKIVIRSSVTVNAPADRVWSILADDFEHVADWASTIPASGPNPLAVNVPDGATTAGRSCTIPGFGVTDERFTAFDPAARTLAYSATATNMPGFVTGLDNTWRIRPVGPTRCEASTVATANLSGPLGVLLAPMLRWQLGRTIRPALDDLRVFAETGRVSDRKAKQAAQAGRSGPSGPSGRGGRAGAVGPAA